MMRIGYRGMRLLGGALVDPVGTARTVSRRANFEGALLAAGGCLVALGLATLPRQLAVLERALSATGNSSQDLHYELLENGLIRMIVADRLIPSPTILLAAVGVAILAEPLLALARDRRAALWTVAVIGLAPLLVQGLGDIALTYLTSFDSRPSPGDAISIANRFRTGPMLLWRGESSAPPWLVVVNARANLVSLWCVVIWAIGLCVMDGGRLRGWHLAVPLSSVAVGGVVTWILGPLVFSAILGRP